MPINILNVLVSVLILIAFTIPGYIIRKIKLVDAAAVSGLTVVLIFICQPFLTIANFQDSHYESYVLANMAYAFLFSSACMLIMFLIAGLIFKKSKKPASQKGILITCSVFSNCGFMGIPFIKILFDGSENLSYMLIYALIFIVAFNILTWTAGIFFMTGNRKYISFKKAVLNPPTVAFLIALPFFILNLSLKEHFPPLFNAIKLLGDMTTPIAMIILGIKLADIKFKEVINDFGLYASSALKLIVAPAIMFLLLLPFQIDIYLKTALFLSIAMPAASTIVALSQRFGADSSYAAKNQILSTVLSVITIPVMSLMLLLF